MKFVNTQHNTQKLTSNIYSPFFFQNPGYENNNTALHLLVLECCRTVYHFASRTDAIEAIKRISTLIDEVGLDAANAMALTVNDTGQTPIQLLIDESVDPKNTRLTVIKYNAMFTKLLRLMNRRSHRPITETLSLQAVFDSASINKGLSDNLKRNLIIGTYITNTARGLLTDSSTHPQFNNYPVKKQDDITTNITIMRDNMLFARKPGDDPIDFRNSLAINNGIGNCMEYAIFAFAEMRRLKFGIRAEIIYISNGNHVFLVLDRLKDSDLQNPASWGYNAVICDAWSGEVYPAEDLLQRFATLLSLEFQKKINRRETLSKPKQINSITSYNSRFHKIKVEIELPVSYVNKKNRVKMRKALSEGGFIYELANSRDSTKVSHEITGQLSARPPF